MPLRKTDSQGRARSLQAASQRTQPILRTNRRGRVFGRAACNERARLHVRRTSAPGGEPAWLLTFADVMTLILCFFVLLISFSSADPYEFGRTILLMRGAFGILSPGIRRQAPIPHDNWRYLGQQDAALSSKEREPEPDENLPVAALEKLSDELGELSFPHPAHIIPQDDGVLIRIDESLAFDEGSTVLSREAKGTLDLIVDFFLKNKGEILIEAFGDGPSPRRSGYGRAGGPRAGPAAVGCNPVELSVDRALAALDYVRTVGGLPTRRFTVSGYGDDYRYEHQAGGLQFLLVRPGKTTKSFAESVTRGWGR